MSTNLMLDVDQAGELKAAFRRTRGSDGSEWTNEDIKKLSEGSFLGSVLDVLDGRAKIASVENEKPEESKIERIHIINKTTIMVNLDAPPILPYEGAKIKFQTGSGWVRVENRSGNLYVNNRKIILYLSKLQKGVNLVCGYNLQEEFINKPALLLHPNILDALLKNGHLFPQSWRKYKQGKNIFIFFWGVIFDYVRGCEFKGGWMIPCKMYLDTIWDSSVFYAALLEN